MTIIYCEICHKDYKSKGWLSRHKWKKEHFTQAEIDENKRLRVYENMSIENAEESIKHPLGYLGKSIPLPKDKTVRFFRYNGEEHEKT